MFFDEKGRFPDTCRELLRSLRGAAIEHVFVGSVAMRAYGCEYAEDRVDVCVRPGDVERFRGEFAGHVFEPLPGQSLRYYLPATQVEIELFVSGEVAGDSLRQQEIRYPDPREAEYVEGVPIASLARLIELKLVSWDPRDRDDVVRLVAANKLDRSYAERLHEFVRPSYLECCTLDARRGISGTRC